MHNLRWSGGDAATRSLGRITVDRLLYSTVLCQQSAILACILVSCAALQYAASNLFEGIPLLPEYGTLVVLPAFGRHQRGRRGRALDWPRADTVLLIGDDPDLAIIAVDARRRGRRPVRCTTLEEAGAASPTLWCDDAIISAGLATDAARFVDARGRPLDLQTARDTAERLLGRVRLNPAASLEAQRIECSIRYHDHRHLKRAIDLLTGLIGSAILLPATILVACLLWRAGQRPILERTRCAARYGQEFYLVRFNLSSLIETAAATGASIIHGDRLPPLAHLLRRVHLDAGPTLWHLLRGELSLVGPRPGPVDIGDPDAIIGLLERQRRLVKPGLISLARVRFRSSDTARDRRLALEYDLYYAKYWSLGLDLRIIGRAAWQLLCGGWQAGVRGLSRLWVARARWLSLHRARNVRPAALASVPLPRDLIHGGHSLKPALIVGAGVGGEHVSRELRRRPIEGLWPVAFVDDDPAKFGRRINGVPVLGDTRALGAIVLREHVDTVVIAIPSASDAVIGRIAADAHAAEARVLRMPDIGTVLRGGPAIALQSIAVSDILGRPTVNPDIDRCRAFLHGKRVLVTGAVGSIGRELMRQLLRCQPAAMFGLDINESDLFDLDQELRAESAEIPFTPVVASVTNRDAMRATLERYQPEIIFHAAAYKHVPMMERHPSIAIRTNSIATYHLARLAAAAGVERFVLVSTDKAVCPSSVMGASKRLAELAVRDVARETGLSACAVRFGNVLGSRGSVIPTFEKQIAAGGPVTVTDARMMRYFMTIPEAASLIIQAGAFGHTDVIYMLDMGEEVAIRELAERLIRLRGLTVGKDIDIVYTGVRSGEKLRESLAHDFETARPTAHPKIRILAEDRPSAGHAKSIAPVIHSLTEIAQWEHEEMIRAAVMRIVQTADSLVVDEIERPTTTHPESGLATGAASTPMPLDFHYSLLSRGVRTSDERKHDWPGNSPRATVD